MRKLFLFLALCFFLTKVVSVQAQASLSQEPPPPQEHFLKGKVLSIVKEHVQNIEGFSTLTQTIRVQILEGRQKGTIITIDRSIDTRIAASQKIIPQAIIILDVIDRPGLPSQYTITDTYRLDYLFYIIIAFFLFTILVTGSKGFGAIVGLFISLFIIMGFIIPQILNHHDPLFISIIGSCMILLITTYFAHGFSRQTTIAVIATFLSLGATCLLAILAVYFTKLAGLGTEDSYLLELNPTQSINPKGLFLGGILIGTIGALNDVTITQVASIFTLKKTNKNTTIVALIEQGFLIGREHILSLVNTLVLAYAGSSLVILIFFILNTSHLPIWVILNNESTAEEIIRTITGSMGLIVSVPIATVFASWYVMQSKNHV
jgi:uncharacterized membrane protein